ncbi:MAG: hypothetical protein ABW122_04040 [Ilumatobacteraceae bacterium]
MTATRSAALDVDDDATPTSIPRPERRTLVHALVLGVVVATSASLAIALHRNGHTTGDDFALYLRQARSLFDGDVAQVVADNRFTVISSGGLFSPIAYPWGWPLLLSPFVHLWGYDYGRLKLLEVAAFCLWLVLAHGIVRRRAGRLLAIAVVAVVGTAPVLLLHTDQLLSEYPHAAMVAVFIWWLDRIKAHRPLIAASTSQLVVLGVIGAAAYNIRREAVILVAVVAATQIAELLLARRHGPGVPIPWKTVGTPYAAFFGSIISFQLLLPSMLMPDNGDSPSYVLDRMGDFTHVLTDQLGIGDHPQIGVAILALAAVGMVVGCIRRPQFDVSLAVLTILSAVTVSTHFRMVGRYYFQILPWLLYFAAVAVIAGVELLLRPRDRRFAVAAAVVPMVFLVGVHVKALPDDISAAQRFNEGGRQQIGPTDPTFAPVFAAVEQYTPPDAVIVFYRARLMTLYTDRRTIQTTSLDIALRTGDYYAQQRYTDYSQPPLTATDAATLGLVEVWSDAKWILWRLPDPV